ncbi:MAG: DUF3626 domain-containing protein [Bdellovibrio sp.]|nr:DUF3626 domain-containing protein [Bdellovibrio sp.]
MISFLNRNSKISLAILAIAYAPACLSAVACVDLFQQGKKAELEFSEYEGLEARSGLQNLYLKIEKLDQGLVTGKVTPRWQDFDNIDQVLETLPAFVANLKTILPGKLTTFYKNWNNSIVLGKRDNVVEKNGSSNSEVKYGPIDYGLRSAYLEKLQRLNQFLPSRAQFPNVTLAPDLNKLALKNQAVEVVKVLESTFDELLKADTGLDSWSEIAKALREVDQPTTQALNAIQNDQFQFSMLRPEKGRFWIDKTGFHNQFVTGSSRGALSNLGRNGTEASYLGLERYEYEKSDSDLKPKYGYLTPLSSKVGTDRPHYGEDRYVFKKEKVQSRVTFTLSDSLNELCYAGIAWQRGDVRTPSHWDHVFIPWARKEILAPFMGPNLVKNYLGLVGSEPDLSKTVLSKLKRSNLRSEYIELQYWGPLTLDDVDSFIFTGAAPSGDFLTSLQSRGIKIYKETGGRLKRWKAN